MMSALTLVFPDSKAFPLVPFGSCVNNAASAGATCRALTIAPWLTEPCIEPKNMCCWLCSTSIEMQKGPAGFFKMPCVALHAGSFLFGLGSACAVSQWIVARPAVYRSVLPSSHTPPAL